MKPQSPNILLIHAYYLIQPIPSFPESSVVQNLRQIHLLLQDPTHTQQATFNKNLPAVTGILILMQHTT